MKGSAYLPRCFASFRLGNISIDLKDGVKDYHVLFRPTKHPKTYFIWETFRVETCRHLEPLLCDRSIKMFASALRGAV